MKKTVYSIMFCLLFFALVFPSAANALVRLKNVSQSGTGSTGTIRIELNGDYDRSKVKIDYETDHISFMMNDAFVMPVKKVFKSSSAKSSVLKMEASMVPSTKRSGGTVKLNIYFRVPIETIKKTGLLSGRGNVLNFNYKTAGEVKETAVTATNDEPSGQSDTQAPSIPESGIQDNGDQNIKPNVVAEARTKDIESKLSGGEEQPDSASGEETGLWTKIMVFKGMLLKFIKIAAVLLGVVVFLFLGLFFFKRYSEQKGSSSSTITDFSGLSKANTMLNTGIRVINSFDLEEDKKLYIIEVSGERMLIGSSKQSVTMITKLSGPEQAEGIDQEHEAIMRSRLKDKLRNL
jgi:flagellar biogenesis protein FliO